MARASIRNQWLLLHGFNSITPRKIRKMLDLPPSLQKYLMFSDLEWEMEFANEVVMEFDMRLFGHGSLSSDRLSNCPLPKGWEKRLANYGKVVVEL